MRRCRTTLALLSALFLCMGLSQAHAGSTAAATLPTVNVPTVCAVNNTAGTFWAVFQSDSSGRRRPHRGGFTANAKWNIAKIQVIGSVAGRGYTDGTVTFNPDVRSASDYTPARTPYGTKSTTSLAVYLVFTDGRKCSINIPSN